jgi:hypothetical protein
MLLHEHKEFKDLIAAVSDAMGIDPTLVKKRLLDHALPMGVATARIFI